MKRKDNYRHEAMLRAKQFLTDHPLANAHLTAAESALSEVLHEIQAFGTDQDLGREISVAARAIANASRGVCDRGCGWCRI
jgi:hypothetical protein